MAGMSPVSGRVVGHYKLLEKLGEGGMGVVYKARHMRLDRFVAIKTLRPERVGHPGRIERFIHEAKSLSALNHPNIVHVYDVDQADGTDFIVMEFVAGKTLERMISRRGMPAGDALKYAVQIADAVAAANAGGIIHRDLKPRNIMVTEQGLVKVLDFGLAKLVDPGDATMDATCTLRPQTEEGMIVGTAAYMSPEQADGRPIDARSDVFSFGAVLYEMLTGRPAFQRGTRASTVAAVLHDEPEPASRIAPSCPPEMERILRRCLRKDPAQRFQDMDDVKVALEELKRESESGVGGVLRESGAPPRRRRWLPWAASALAALALAAALVWFGRSKTSQSQPTVVVPLTAYPGSERSASFSPDGLQVAFVWCKDNEGKKCNIYIKELGAEAEPPFQLTQAPAAEYSPVWAPNGQFIAFLRLLPPSRLALMLVSQRGSRERELAEFDLVEDIPDGPYLAWAPDSKWLVHPVPQKGRTGLAVVNVLTRETRALTSPPRRGETDEKTSTSPQDLPMLAFFLVPSQSGVKTLPPARAPSLPPQLKTVRSGNPVAPHSRLGFGDSTPAISPDGRTLAFARLDSARSDLYLLPLAPDYVAGGEPKKIPSDQQLNLDPAWLPDGKSIVFSSGRMNNLGLWRVQASSGAKPKRLAFAQGDTVEPAVSRQGSRLAYTSARFDTNIYRIDLHDPLRKVAAGPLIYSKTPEDEPAYSPGGKKVAFVSERSGTREIWVCDSDGANPFKLTSFEARMVEGPQWSWDGRDIAFYVLQRAEPEIYVINARGGVPRRISTPPGGGKWPYWSRDGQWLYFAAASLDSDVWKAPVKGGAPVLVTRNTGDMPQESPDGKFLYYMRGWPLDISIWRIPVAGGEETKVLDSIHSDGQWAMGEAGIYYFTLPDANGRTELRLYDLATERKRKILTMEGSVGKRFSVSPDGRSLLYTQVDETGSDLMLVENFR